jgi:hypothetical protein
VVDHRIAGRVLEVVVRTEAEVVVVLLRRRVDPAALVAGERPLLVVAGDQVLPQLRAHRLQEVAGVAQHREVPEQGVLPLHEVADGDGGERAEPRGGRT